MLIVDLPGLGPVPAVRYLTLDAVARVAKAVGESHVNRLRDVDGGGYCNGAYAVNVANKLNIDLKNVDDVPHVVTEYA